MTLISLYSLQCGVIDVVPDATSRDEMGRAKINDLLAFFIGRFGNVDGIAFQRARINFIQSMAAYSLLCYILQIKDRHNGNIMIDGEGHIVHIDFGFLFDIDKLHQHRPASVPADIVPSVLIRLITSWSEFTSQDNTTQSKC